MKSVLFSKYFSCTLEELKGGAGHRILVLRRRSPMEAIKQRWVPDHDCKCVQIDAPIYMHVKWRCCLMGRIAACKCSLVLDCDLSMQL